MKSSLFKIYAWAWIAIAFFLRPLIQHGTFGWHAFVNEAIGINEATGHGHSAEICSSLVETACLVEMRRDTFENRQSEFLQPLRQVIQARDMRYRRDHGHAKSRAIASPRFRHPDALARIAFGVRTQHFSVVISRSAPSYHIFSLMLHCTNY